MACEVQAREINAVLDWAIQDVVARIGRCGKFKQRLGDVLAGDG